VVQSSGQASFTSENVGSILATDSCGKVSQSFPESCGFSPGYSGFLPQGMLTVCVGISP
jgi:hypothetical protein